MIHFWTRRCWTPLDLDPQVHQGIPDPRVLFIRNVHLVVSLGRSQHADILCWKNLFEQEQKHLERNHLEHPAAVHISRLSVVQIWPEPEPEQGTNQMDLGIRMEQELVINQTALGTSLMELATRPLTLVT